MKNLQWYDFTLVANCLQTVELTAISLYKQHENIAHDTEPIQRLTGLAADTSSVNAKATMQIPRGAGRDRGHHASSEPPKPRHIREALTSCSFTLKE